MKKVLILAVVFFLIPFWLYAQKGKPGAIILEDYCVTADEVHLYRLINEYRLVFDLEIIPLSKSLSFVAHTHVRDLFQNRPDLQSCNLHSWSDKGSWSPCCYAKDPNRTNCMWNKPRELTGYMGNGQELILWENIPVSSRSAFDQWRNFELTNDMILNRGRWHNKTWKAMGIAIFEGYASVWFGEVVDHEKTLLLCDDGQELASHWLLNETAVVPEEEAVIEPEPEIPLVKYYLIVGSFKEETQAKNEVRRLQTGGYSDARVVVKDENFRVSVFDFKDLPEAQKMRRQLDAVFKGIWIMEK